MDLTIRIDPPTAGSQRVALGGRLDTHSYAELDQQLAPLLASTVPSLVLDLASTGEVMPEASTGASWRSRSR